MGYHSIRVPGNPETRQSLQPQAQVLDPQDVSSCSVTENIHHLPTVLAHSANSQETKTGNISETYAGLGYGIYLGTVV